MVGPQSENMENNQPNEQRDRPMNRGNEELVVWLGVRVDLEVLCESVSQWEHNGDALVPGDSGDMWDVIE
jgi:hypothetical protein